MCRWLQPGIRRPGIVALHRSLGKLGQQGSNLNVLLNNVLNILIVNLGPEGSPRHALQRAKGQKRRWTHDFALGPKPNYSDKQLTQSFISDTVFNNIYSLHFSDIKVILTHEF
jgi:hypothetical protein